MGEFSMRKYITITILLMLVMVVSACAPQAEPTLVATLVPTRNIPNIPDPTSTPRQQFTQTTYTPTVELTFTPEPATTEPPLPDLSGVTLYEATHLMDPRYFQVALAGWPEGIPEGIVVRVGKEIFECDLLFPQKYPDRLYCWGLAPPKGTQVMLQVIMENVARPLLEITFMVPWPDGN
jgi:hypothetical protein